MRRLLLLGLAGCGVLAAVLAGPQLAGQTDALVGRASVLDGDTIEIHGQRIRLHGIDAPEGRQACTDAGGRSWRCGQQAANALADAIGASPVRCLPRDVDRYGRTIAVCHKGGEDLNGWLVRSGWAVAYRRFSLDYAADEDRARAARRGIWAGSFDMPWDWRAAQRER